MENPPYTPTKKGRAPSTPTMGSLSLSPPTMGPIDYSMVRTPVRPAAKTNHNENPQAVSPTHSEVFRGTTPVHMASIAAYYSTALPETPPETPQAASPTHSEVFRGTTPMHMATMAAHNANLSETSYETPQTASLTHSEVSEGTSPTTSEVFEGTSPIHMAIMAIHNSTLSETSHETPQAASPTLSEVFQGTSPLHRALMASYNPTAQPKKFHERLDFGREVNLAPGTNPQETINLVLKVCNQPVHFTVHIAIICFYSPYFHEILGHGNGVTTHARIQSRMLRREWRWEHEAGIDTMEGNGFGDAEGKVEVDVHVKLPITDIRKIDLTKQEFGDLCPRTVAAFVDWLYLSFSGFTFNGSIRMKHDSTTIIKLWAFAGKIGVPACQNHCIEAIELCHLQTGVVNVEMIRWVYNNTDGIPGNEKLKQLLIDQCAWRLPSDYVINGGLGNVPREALAQILGQARLLLQLHVDVTTNTPPFKNAEERKDRYWIEDDSDMA